MKFIDENTKVTFTLVLAIIGGILWLARINYMAEAAAESITKVESRQEKYVEDIADIKKDIAVIRTIIEGENK